MLRVGLTGNVAAGKSAVLALFAEWGAATIDADRLAREAVAPGTDGLRAVLERFGADLRQPDGSLDRGALRRRVMAVPAEREALNAIVHPIVLRHARDAEARARASGAAIVVHDIPLLFEVLDPAAFDAVVLVDAPEAIRRERLVRERGLPPADADALIAAQLPADLKRARATLVIDNGGTRAELRARARAVWDELQRRAAVA
jgi:dephospho-CoA kinase